MPNLRGALLACVVLLSAQAKGISPSTTSLPAPVPVLLPASKPAPVLAVVPAPASVPPAPAPGESLYSFTSNTFTPAGAAGTDGPKLRQTQAAYAAQGSWVQNSSYLADSFGTQVWTVPKTGTYTFEIAGAAGGSRNDPGGLGAKFSFSVRLSIGAKLGLAIGQVGQTLASASGGGATIVVMYSQLGSSLLAVAGGGGGAGLESAGMSSTLVSPQSSPATPGSGGAGAGGTASAGYNGLSSYSGGDGGTTNNVGDDAGGGGGGCLLDPNGKFYGGNGGIAYTIGGLSNGIAGGFGLGGGSGAAHEPPSTGGAGGGGGYSGGKGGLGVGGAGSAGTSFISSSITTAAIVPSTNPGDGFLTVSVA